MLQLSARVKTVTGDTNPMSLASQRPFFPTFSQVKDCLKDYFDGGQIHAQSEPCRSLFRDITTAEIQEIIRSSAIRPGTSLLPDRVGVCTSEQSQTWRCCFSRVLKCVVTKSVPIPSKPNRRMPVFDKCPLWALGTAYQTHPRFGVIGSL